MHDTDARMQGAADALGARPGIGSHTSPGGGSTDCWLTPPEIIEALGPFDLDPCACPGMPWRTAVQMIAPPDDGLMTPWSGRVWLNPPYGAALGAWLTRLAHHGDGIALVFARTETQAFSTAVWGRADALLFVVGRLHFHLPNGERARANSGGPSVLIAYGPDNAECLRTCGIRGAYVREEATTT